MSVIFPLRHPYVINKINHGTTSLLLVKSMTLTATDRPNVVIIYSDDVGFADVTVYGSTMIDPAAYTT